MPSQDIYQINRKYTVNAQFFDKIDNEEKAYWLGFLWADGGLTKSATRCAGPNRLRLAQHKRDLCHIKAFAQALQTNYPIRKAPKDIMQIDINSRPICKALINLGYGSKDERTNIPAIPNALIPHFIRGYFDGDGCLSIYQQHVKQYTINKQEWSLTGNEELLLNIKHVLEKQANVTPTVKMKHYKRTSKAVSLRYGKKTDIERLFKYLYIDCRATVYLQRKYQKFQDYFSRLTS